MTQSVQLRFSSFIDVLGVEVHEEPYVREGNQTALKPGMTFTVELGIYLLGRLGISLEDNILPGTPSTLWACVKSGERRHHFLCEDPDA
ncbi:MAG: M24 family metallopeptidase [Candidatus Caldarchaeum sp.]